MSCRVGTRRVRGANGDGEVKETRRVGELGGCLGGEGEGEHILGAVGCGQGLTTFSWIWLLDTEMLREACPGERGRRR